MKDQTMPDPMTEELSLTVSRQIAASPEKVYMAWLDPAQLMRFFANGKGFSLAHAETDPRVGGAFRLDMVFGGRAMPPHTGTYLALDPFRRLAFTWLSEHQSREDSLVTIDLTPEAGGTRVTLTHVRFASETARDQHSGGWTMILDALAATAF